MTVDPEIRRGVEAILMVAEDPVHPHLLAQLVDVEPGVLEDVVQELDEAYTAEGRGFVIAKVAGGYRFQSHPDAAPYVERFVLEGQTARLSSAALETLAIVAYKQPISRAQVAAIRGVSVDGVVRTLEQRGYIAEVARDPGPGNAILFGTTPLFLEKLGLDSVADLPPIAQFVPDAGVVEQLEHGLRAEPLPAEPDAREVPDADEVGEDAAEDAERGPEDAEGGPEDAEGGPEVPEVVGEGGPEANPQSRAEVIPEGDVGVVPVAGDVVDGEPAGGAERTNGSGGGAAEDGGEPDAGDGDAVAADDADPDSEPEPEPEPEPGADGDGGVVPEAAERSDSESDVGPTGADPSGDAPDAASS